MNSLASLSTVAADGADTVKDVTITNFMADVMDVSRTIPVVVGFWTARNAPCVAFMALLEKLVRAHKGAMRLARIDIDKSPEIAQQLQVQSVPAIFVFFRGQPMDGFVGVMPEGQLKPWLDRLMKATGATSDEAMGLETAYKQAADFMAAGDFATAQSIYADILDMEPANAVAYAGLIRCLLGAGEVEQAKQMLAAAPADIAKDKALGPVRTALELADQASSAGSMAELQAKLQQDPADHQVRFDLAMAYYAAGNREGAVDELLEIVRRNRGWNEDGARKQLVKLFEAFGPMDPLTIAARKRLSSIMFS